ncbi:MAG: PKD domain-containing protein [Gemmataceae bacterium]
MRLLTRSRWIKNLVQRRPVTIRHANPLRARLGCEDLELRTTPAVIAINPGTLTATEGVPFGAPNAEVKIGEFTINNFNVAPEPTLYSASIHWGDGVITSGLGPPATIRFQNGSDTGNGRAIYEVWSYHTYSDATPPGNPYTLTLDIFDNSGGGNTQSASGSMTVLDQPLGNGAGQPVTAVVGAPLTNVLLATFTDGNPLSTADDFTATISWGNPAQTTAGTVVKNGGSPATYSVYGSHTYDATATPTSNINVFVRSVTQTISIGTQATVANAALLPSATTVSITEGATSIPAGTLIGTFQDTGGARPATSYPTTVQFPGAGGPTTVNVSQVGTTNVYTLTTGAATTIPAAQTGTYNYTLTVVPVGGVPTSTTGQLRVNNAALTMGTVNSPAGAVEGARITNLAVATFSDANTASTGGYIAVVDWGDGSPTSLGTIVQTGAGQFRVEGSHTYTDETPAGTFFRITVTVTDVAGDSIVGQSAPFSVADAGISNPVPVPSTNVVDTRYNLLLGYFTDNNPYGRPSDFTVALNWGDSSGADTVGSVQLVGGTQTTALFAVYGTHGYANPGNFTVTATITDQGAPANLVINTPITVLASQVSASANPIVASEGVATAAGLTVGTIYSPGAANAAALNASFNWGDGTLLTTGGGGLTVVSLGAGNYSVLAIPHTYAAFGTYSTTLNVQEIGGGSATSTNVAAVSNGTLTATAGAGPFTAQEGTAFTFAAGNPVITFTDTNLGATAGQFTALIHWGDGQTSVGTVTATGPGAFRVTGAHTYTKDGNYTIFAEVEDNGGAKAGSLVPFVATSATYNGTALTINAVQNSPLINVEVATFTSSNGFDTASRFYATINWGDGTPNTAGLVVQDATATPPTFHVIGSHTYTTAGSFNRTITISKGDPVVILTLGGGGGGGGGGGAVAVASSPITSTAVNVNGIEGVALPNAQVIPGSTIVATFTDPGSLEPLSAYTAQINWGNGQVTAGTVLFSGGTYTVVAPAAPPILYPNVGNFTFLVTVTKTVGLASFLSYATGTAQIANAQLTAANGGPFTVVEGQSLTASPVITFTDQDTTSNPPDFTVSINWGDGTPATGGTITEPTPGNFRVAGTHTFKKNGTYTVTVTVTDDAGASVSATATVVATQAPMTPNAPALAINAVQNSPLIDVEVANFLSGNPFDVASQFAATIAWGDGSTTAGQVVQDAAGRFRVLGTHTYANPGPFSIQVEVAEGDPVIVIPMYNSANVTVAPSPLTVSPVTVNGIEGVALPNAGTVIGGTIVATFTDGGAAAPVGNYSATIDFGGAIGLRPGTVIQTGSNFTVLLGGAPVVIPDVGSSTFTVTITKTGGFLGYGAGTVNIANAAITVTNGGALPAVVEGQTFTATNANPLITFDDQDTTSVPGQFTAVVNWGDGSPTTIGTVNSIGPVTVFTVVGSHIYKKNGTYTVTVTVTDDAGKVVTGTATATVTQATITAGPQTTLSGLQNSPLLDVEVSTFTSANPYDVASQFIATITWGDGTQSTGTVTQGANGVFHVVGSHTYANAGSFAYSVTVAEGDPTIVLPNYAAGTATIAATPLLVLPVQVNGTEGIVLPNAPNALNGTVVATFLDLGAAAPLANYSAQIIWGNGQTTAGVVQQDGPNFIVLAPAVPNIVYPNVGNYSIRVNVTKQTGAGSFVAYGIGTASIANATLTPVASAPVTGFQQTPLLNVEVGRFLDGNPTASLSEYSATIDWGDGTPASAATFLRPGGPGTVVIVYGNHTYANPSTPPAAPYVITVVVQDDDGGQVRLNNTAIIQQSVLTGTPVTISGIENQTFANVVVAYFSDSATPGPVSSYSATITWGDGGPNSIGQIVPLGGNNFAVLGTKNYANAGNYPVTVVITRNGLTGVTVVSTAAIADAPINGTAVPFFAVEGANFTGTVAFFTSANPADPGTDFSALITWGDGTTSTGTVVANGAGFRVTAVDPGSGAGKRYQDEGQYTFSVRVTSIDGATFTAYEVATVMDAPLTATGVTTTIPEWPAFNGIVATFFDANPFALASTPEHVATINWGDGVTSTGVITQNFSAFPNPTSFTVTGTHLYEPGVYQVTITIVDEGGSRTTALSTITVTDSPLTAGPAITITSQEGQPVTAQVATFTDANPLGQISEFSATINWGDGTPVSSAIIGQTAAGVFTVTGTHTYAAFTTAPLPVVVTIRSIDGATTTVTSSAVVTNAPLSSEGANITGVEGNSTGNVIVATFTDANPNSNISHFTSGGGLITVSWGDGTPDTTVTAGNVTSLGSANGVTYTVRAAHTYARKGSYQVTTTIRDNGGATTVANGQATIANGTLTRAGVQPTISGTEGQTFSGVVFTFLDSNPLAVIGDYVAEVNWGDGHIDAGVISQSGGVGTPFNVSATHFFFDSGTYTIGVTVTDIDGATIGYTASYVVANVAPTAVIANNGPVNENSPVTVTLSDPRDPSPADVTAGFRYSFSLTSGGLATSYLGASPSNSAQFVLPDGLVPPVGTTIFGRIFDKDGGFTDYTTSVTVLNVAPTATFSVSLPLIAGQPSLVSFTNQFDPSPVDTAAGFRYSYDLGTGVFGPLTTSPTATFVPPGPGTFVIRGRIFDKDGSVANGSFTEYIARDPNGNPGIGVVVPNVDIFAAGAGVDGGPIVHVYSAQTYNNIYTFTAYEPTFRGGVLVAVGDVTGDGIPDIITGTGNGGGPVVKVFAGPLFAEVVSFFAYESTFRGGVLVATADVDGDGREEIVTGTGIGGGPVVKVFSLSPAGVVTERSSFYAYDSTARGGVFVAGGNASGAPRDAAGRAVEEIITGAGAGGGPHVKVFTGTGAEISSFFAYEPSVLGGVTVSAGDLYGTGYDNIVTGTGAKGGPNMKIWGPTGLPLFTSFAAFGPDKVTGEPLRNGFTVSAKHIGGPNGRPILIAGAGRDYGPTVRVFDAVTLDAVVELVPFEKEFTGGVYVG